MGASDDGNARFEKMRLEVLREVDQMVGDIGQDVSDIRKDMSNHVTEVKNDIKNLKWFFGIAFAALFSIFSLILALVASLANII